MAFSDYLSYAEASNMVDFYDEFIRLVEAIILVEKEEMDRIDEAEKEIKKDRAMYKASPFFQRMSDSQVSLYFMKQRVSLVEKTLRDFPTTKRYLERLWQWIRRNRTQAAIMQTSITSSNINAAELYANYFIAVREKEKYKTIVDLHNMGRNN